ncbi:unnamed protein product [Gongylonema pulchrum]|uniref:SHSP domain-containing protein n=1 Tax=Gongylonema pulchrum TaxID=637853 RepID=A0A183EGQ5_9BILA|nr:unnamed protein product [Gongylonema pulchrum]
MTETCPQNNKLVSPFIFLDPRKFRLPPNVPAEAVNSSLTADGHLSVSASAPRYKDDGVARTIPIKMVPSVVKTENITETKPQNITTSEQSSTQG